MKRGKSPPDLPGVVKASRDIPGGHQVSLELEAEREHVPAILLVPDGASTRRPGALLLHGFTSRKERMAEGFGRALLARGVATLAIDLPLHGAREGSIDELSLRNPLQLIGAWRLALAEIRSSLDYLTKLAVIDATRIALVGYSLGSFLSVIAAADDDRVRAMVLASGGDLPDRTPFAALVRAAADPLRAVRKFAGRPLRRRSACSRPRASRRKFIGTTAGTGRRSARSNSRRSGLPRGSATRAQVRRDGPKALARTDALVEMAVAQAWNNGYANDAKVANPTGGIPTVISACHTLFSLIDRIRFGFAPFASKSPGPSWRAVTSERRPRSRVLGVASGARQSLTPA
jgi:dienelactone hydrolase